MSSHHIVRDQQEPALLIDQLDHFPVKVLHALLEWSPTVLCCEPSIDIYSRYGHKLDVALVGFQQVEMWDEKLKEQMPVEVRGIEENSFLDKGLSNLRENGHKAVNIITDDFSLIGVIQVSLKWISFFDLVIYTETKRHIVHKKPVYKKWLPSFSEISVLPLQDRSYFSTTGFALDLEEEWLQEGIELQKSREGDISINCNKVPYLISEKF